MEYLILNKMEVVGLRPAKKSKSNTALKQVKNFTDDRDPSRTEAQLLAWDIFDLFDFKSCELKVIGLQIDFHVFQTGGPGQGDDS